MFFDRAKRWWDLQFSAFTNNSNLSHPSRLVIPTGGLMGLRPTQEDEKHADQEDLFPSFRTKNKKLWVPHISRSEMWEGCRTAVG